MNQQYITRERLKWLAIIAGSAIAIVVLPMMLIFMPYYIPFGLVIGSIGMILIIKYPYYGLIVYMTVIFLRPGETLGIPLVTKASAGAVLVSLIVNIALKKRIAPWTALNITMLAFFAAVSLSAVNAFWLGGFIESWQYALRLIILFLLIINLIDSPEKFRQLGLVILFLTAFVCVLSVKEYFAQGGTGFRTSGITGGMFASANDFAQIVDMFLPFPMLLFSHVRKAFHKLIFAGMVALGLMALVMTGSRGGFLGLLAVFFVLTWRSSRKVVLVFMAIIIIGAGLIFAPPTYLERIQSITEYEEDQSASDRIEAWKAGLRMFQSSPLTGVGAGCFNASSEQYGFEHDLVAHNTFVSVLAEMGAVGIVTFLLLFYFAFRGCDRVRRRLESLNQKNSWPYLISTALTASLAAYMVTAFFLTTTFYPNIYMLLAMCAALEMIFLYRSGDSTEGALERAQIDAAKD
jgi:probable O-glycosylation ligase (exosortase A-associated)